MPNAPPSPREVRLPGHIVDLDADELRSVSGGYVDLRPRSFAVLRVLAESVGRLVGKGEIIDTVWGDVVVTEDSLTQCIADIRRAIGDDDHRVLRTIARKGYILVPSRRMAQLAGKVPDRPSLAVMPLLSIGGDESLGAGIAVHILNELARNKDLRLLARDSSFALAKQNLMAQEIGGHLGARYLVEGTVQRVDGTLLVDVQLVDTRDGSIAWGDRFTAIAADLPQVQRDIATTIAGSLHAGMRETEKRAILGAGPRDLDVYELTLRGIARKHQFNPEATRAGRADLEEATRRDPDYAPAHTYLAWINLIDMLNQFTGEWQFSQLGEVVAQFNHAVALDPNLPTTYQGLSHALIYTGDIPHSVAAARRAVALAPNDADALLFLGVTLFEAGELAEALEMVEGAVALNPLRAPYYDLFYAMILWGNERYQAALEQADECLRKAPNSRADAYRIMALVGLGRVDEAKAQLTQSMAKPSGLIIIPPRSPELAARAMAALHAAGWRPTLAADREAV